MLLMLIKRGYTIFLDPAEGVDNKKNTQRTTVFPEKHNRELTVKIHKGLPN